MVSIWLYIRARWLKNIGLDDYIIAASMENGLSSHAVMLTAYTVVTTVNVELGYGKHTPILLINYADFALGIMSFTTPKLAIAALVNRILNPGSLHRMWIWGLTAMVFVASSICIVVLFIMCDPPEAVWEIELMSTGATCRPTSILVGYAIFTGPIAISAFVDLYLAVYPAIVLARLQITLKKKLPLCVALGMGAVASAMAIVKCFQLPNTTADLLLWTSIESNIIIMASCIPTLGTLYEMILGRRSLSTQARYYKSSGQQLHSSVDRYIKKPSAVATAKNGSQEIILKTDEPRKEGHPPGRIQRTDDVVVQYKMGPLDRESTPEILPR
ncbi:hypothetical protein BDW59DRAFT_176925 [Aspergillus cavernicola]|uniref:Rhodopsin domain-containing protein n=1 Tax=Aspergillus cavernicola TaxID=176166 RepID=A0ABR4HD21_9EURO